MTCEVCGAANKATAKFCADCGSALARSCPSCGNAVRPGQRFCDECGSALPQGSAPADGASPDDADDTADRVPAGRLVERRVCSVLFCDLVGFTPLSEAKDPEDVRELLSRYFDLARTIIARYGGTVEKFIGDAVMAVWGTPSATEEDAERAVRAALDLVAAVEQHGRDSGLPGLAARAGVVTGAVAVTVGASGEGMVAGDAVNTAARVQATAPAGSVFVDEGTWRVAQSGVGFTAAGEHLLKGKSGPTRLWRAERVLSAVGGVQRIDGLEAPFVGRDSELRLVKELFHTAEQRKGTRLVSVTGAAGVGKSRLGWEFEKYVDGLAAVVRWHRGRCLSYGDGVAFWALAEMVRQRFQIAEEDPTAVAAEKLDAGLEQWLPDAADREYVRPRLAQLLGVDVGGQRLGREELFPGWRLFFERMAAVHPVVMVVEDLQHADDGFLDFIEHLLDWTRDLPIFVLTFARPELESRRPGWGTGRRNSTALTLDPLDAAAMRLLLDGLVPDMPATAQAAIAGRAEGIPLYAVETVRMLIDRDVVQPVDGVYRLVGDLGELTVPATLKSLLAARLDALDADARALIADAAVLGGSFPLEALVAVSGQSEDHVRAQVAELVRREVLGVRADPLSPQRGQYAFVQTIFRQVAYDTLSRRERKARHLAVAAHLRQAFADDGEEVVEVIATHIVDAINAVPDDPDVPELQLQAVDALLRAADRATRTGAPAAAARTLLTAAELLERQDSDDADLAAAVLRERAGAVLVTAGDLDAAEREYRLAVDTYRRHADARATARAQTEVGAVLRRLGRLDDARKQLAEAVQVLKSEPDRAYVHALAEQATLEAFAGNAADADALSAAALAEAQALGLPEDGYPELFVIRGLVHGRGSRPMQAAANFREVVRLGQESGHTFSVARALLNLGDVLMSIDPVAAAKASRSGRDLCRRTGARYLLGTVVANLIQSLLLTGDWDEAREVYASALADDDLVDDLPTAWGSVMLLAFSGERDQLAAATRVFPAESEDPQDGSAAATARAAGAVLEGNWSDAQRYANEALSFASALSLHADTICWSWPIAADAALELHDTAEAVRLVELLESHRPGHVPAVLHAERKRIEARLLAAASDPGAAPAFERAVDGFRQLASPYHLAVCLLDAADHRLASDDPDGALQYAREAGGIASRLGADPLAKRAERLIEEPVVQASAAEATVS